ncbi:hypothetical protein [Virgibacillus oceani]|uniref:hypothetical protein n=1 Tax=Virgibacillus oceani TaxID=1479511 RepID=UPI001666AC31|nr:hypothetical protein [Virgibacillus oceani]
MGILSASMIVLKFACNQQLLWLETVHSQNSFATSVQNLVEIWLLQLIERIIPPPQKWRDYFFL